tara:strand:+ start:273 stop:401 length:129 start_codon:yes stop_codon:yes gene_type:complete
MEASSIVPSGNEGNDTLYITDMEVNPLIMQTKDEIILAAPQN